METPIKSNQQKRRSHLFSTPIKSHTPTQSPSRSVQKTLNSFSSVGGARSVYLPLNRHNSLIRPTPHVPVPVSKYIHVEDSVDQKYFGFTPQKYYNKLHHEVNSEERGRASSHPCKDSYVMKKPINLPNNLVNDQVAIRQTHWDKSWKIVTCICLVILAVFGLIGAAAYSMLMTPSPLIIENQLSKQLVPLERSLQETALTEELLMMKRTIMLLSEEVSGLRSKVNLIQGPQSEILKPSKGILEELLTDEPDLACEGSGGSVIATPDTLTLTVPHQSDIFWGLHSFTRDLPHNPPQTTIKGMIQGLGDCWGFRGSVGRLVLRLSQPSRLTSVTVSHIPRSISPSGTIPTAPRNFKIVAHKAPEDSGWLLGEFEYMQFGSWRQTFPLEPQVVNELIQIVEFQFLNNYGHPNFTCIYRVHVHGDFKL